MGQPTLCFMLGEKPSDIHRKNPSSVSMGSKHISKLSQYYGRLSIECNINHYEGVEIGCILNGQIKAMGFVVLLGGSVVFSKKTAFYKGQHFFIKGPLG